MMCVRSASCSPAAALKVIEAKKKNNNKEKKRKSVTFLMLGRINHD